MSRDVYLDSLENFAATELAPIANQIDQHDIYPKDFMHAYGKRGGFAAHGNKAFMGLGYGLATQIESIANLGRFCGSTAFNAWCQTTCAWYIQNSNNKALQAHYLADVLSAKILAGTGLSNTMKSLSGIEKHNLSAVPNNGGFKINGTLRAVTNIGEDHIWAATAEIDDGNLLMFLIEGGQAGVTLNQGVKFCALNGTQTLSVQCENVQIPLKQVLAQPFEFKNYLEKIKSGFVLLQLGMALGALYAAADIMSISNQHIAELNNFLDYRYDDLVHDIASIQQSFLLLTNDTHRAPQFLQVLKLRLFASEIVLKSAQSAALHSGAMGYTQTHHAQRLSREAMFVAIITPSIKHLKKEIERLEQLENAKE